MGFCLVVCEFAQGQLIEDIDSKTRVNEMLQVFNATDNRPTDY